MTSAANSSPQHPMPFTRVEACVLGLGDDGLEVLLGLREADPFKGSWAMPGGVLRIDLDATLDDAVRRVMRERLSLELPFLRQLIAVGGKARDTSRSPWALSIVYRALVWRSQVKPLAGKRLKDLAWRSVDEVVADDSLAFDHRELIAQAVKQTRWEVESLELPAGFLPDMFTLGELQSICERVLGRPLDKSSFRRKLNDRELVEPVPGGMRGGANRPAQLYRLCLPA